MRRSRVNNAKYILSCALVTGVAFAAPFAHAQAQQAPQIQGRQLTGAQQALIDKSLANAMSNPLVSRDGRVGGEERSYYSVGQSRTMTQAEYNKALQESDSPQAKAEILAAKRKSQRALEKNLAVDAGEEPPPPPPEDLVQLQSVGIAPDTALPDEKENNLDTDAAIDLRRDAQKEAALSFGARGGLAKRNFEIMERLEGFETTLDQVYNFRALLINAPSGMLIEPPIVREALDSLVVTEGGSEAAVSDKIFDISKQAKIVTAPRDWRSYMVQAWVSKVPKPPRLLWPKTEKERSQWNDWVALGWRAGAAQADAMFEANLARLTADYQGMIRYRTLLTQGMISQPYAMHEDRGVTGSKTVMRVGDRALRITGPSQFLTGSDLWKPADR